MKEPEETFVEFAMNKEYIRLKSDALQVEVNSSTGGINFYDATGRVLLKDKDYGTQFTPFDDAGTFSYNVRQAFLLDKDEVIYGLGQQQTGKEYLYSFYSFSERLRTLLGQLFPNYVYG